MSYQVRQNPAYSGNYTKGRGGAKVNKIVIHHAATTDFDGIGRTFKAVGRMASAHYGVGRNNNVDQYVDEADMAWHAGTSNPATNPNPTSIGIEHVNSSGAPDWNIDEATFNTSVELVRDIAKRHGLLPLKVGVNLFQHKNFAATYCAGKMGDRLQELADRVNGGSSSGGSSGGGSTSGGKKSNDEIAQEVIDMKWGVQPEREKRLRAAGYDYATIQNLVNQKLGAGGSAPAQSSGGSIVKGSTVEVTNPVDENGTRLATSGHYTVMELNGSRAVIGRGGQVTAALSVANLRLVGGGGNAPAPAQPAAITKGSKVVVTNPVDVNGTRLAVSGVYDVIEVSGDRIVIGKGSAVTAAINRANLRRA